MFDIVIKATWKKQQEMIFENWAKRQFWVARYLNKIIKLKKYIFLESLILAQDERWRHA